MSFHAIASLFNTVSSLALGAFVYLNGKNKTANIMLALYTVAVASWSFGQFMGEIAPTYELGLFWARFHLAGAIFIPVFFVHFVSAFLNRKDRTVVAFAYVIGAIIFAVSFTPLFVPSVSTKVGLRYFPDPGPAFIIYSIMFVCLVLDGMYRLVNDYLRAYGIVKNQIRNVIIASIIGFSGGSMMFLPVYDVKIFPFGYYLVPAYILIAIYAFMKYRFLDISIVIRRGLVYSILTAIVTSAYVLLIVILQEVLKVMAGTESVVAAGVIVIMLIAFLNPLKDRVQRYVDFLFFRRKYDLQRSLRELSSLIRNTVNIDDLADIATKNIRELFNASSISLYSFNSKTAEFVLKGGRGRQVIPESEECAFIESPDRTCLPLIVKGKPVGLLVLEEKLSGEVYTDEDVDILTAIANQMALSLENAMLYENMLESQKHLYQVDKLATMGTLAATLAHEIKNPLASIKGFAQIIPKALRDRDQEAIDDFSAVVPKQLDRVNEMLEKLLRFSRPVKQEMKDVRVVPVIEEMVKLVSRQASKKGIDINLRLDTDFTVKGNADNMMQAFLNIALNSIQAMPDGGVLDIRTAVKGDEKTITFSDTGSGMSREKLDHIFDLFYTTKEGGSGIGLAVTRKILLEHLGKIAVESDPGKGTTFLITF